MIVLVFSIGLLTGFGPYMTLGPTVSLEHWDTRAVYGILASILGRARSSGR